MKSGSIYIKRIAAYDGYPRAIILKEKKYNSVAQRKLLINALAKRHLVNNINIVLSVMPREKL